MQDLYQEIILDHYRHPVGRGLRVPFDAEVSHVNPTCGDEITLRVRLAGSPPVVADVSYDNQGCSISQASASVMNELLVGQTVDDALLTYERFRSMIHGEGITNEEALGDAVAFAGVAKYSARVKCALLAWTAWKDATARAMAQGGLS